jgi:hypothetical protein
MMQLSAALSADSHSKSSALQSANLAAHGIAVQTPCGHELLAQGALHAPPLLSEVSEVSQLWFA